MAIFTYVDVHRGAVVGQNNAITNEGTMVLSSVYVQIDDASLEESAQLGGMKDSDKFMVYGFFTNPQMKRKDLLIDTTTGYLYRIIGNVEQFPDGHCEAYAENFRQGQ